MRLTPMVYLRLIVLTFGTLLPFFWMVVILGHRRQRNFERVFFFLCLALTLFFGNSLLALNAQLYYAVPPPDLLRSTWIFLSFGLWFIPPLVIHLHVEYADVRELFSARRGKRLWLLVAWLPSLALAPSFLLGLRYVPGADFAQPSVRFGHGFKAWLCLSMAIAAFWQFRFGKAAPDDEQRKFHVELSGILLGIFLGLMCLFAGEQFASHRAVEVFSPIVLILAPIPLIALLRRVRSFNFLQIGRQRNLIYAVFVVFLGLIYLSFVRRLGQWLEPYLPPETTAALFLFLPVVFFEPLQRFMRSVLRQTAQLEVDRAQKLMGPINEVARLGNPAKLHAFTETWMAEQLQLADVRLSLVSGPQRPPIVDPYHKSSIETIELRRGNEAFGTLNVRSHGAMVSGEIYAALEFVGEQLPAAFDLCRLIDEKLRLERELAQRERLALLGQMAASISHNLKNPLGSIKTILQVQMENPDLPPNMRQETQMVLEEINRLSAKLQQLLQFSRPAVLASGEPQHCAITAVAWGVIHVLQHEAERNAVALKFQAPPQEIDVAASAEAVNDILSNLVMNAVEAVPRGGHVQLSLAASNGFCGVQLEDDGPGVPDALREKILEPFFTTKARGTGLGLAIVARRLEEIGGKMEIDSPIRNGHGARFRILLPLYAPETSRKESRT